MDFAVIETGGKQYKVSSGTVVKIEKLDAEPGASVSFEHVLLRANGDSVEIGTPYVKGAVQGTVKAQARTKKKIVFRYHAKTRYRKFKTHRQRFTEVEITKI